MPQCSSSPDSLLLAGPNEVMFQTLHNYVSGMDCFSGIYSCPDGRLARVHVKYDLESWYDYFYVYDDSSSDATPYTGNSSDYVWLDPGYSSVMFRFTSDESINRWGVDVDEIDCYAPTTTTSSTTTSSTTINSTSTSTTTTTEPTTTTTLPGPCGMKGNEPPCDTVTLVEVVDSINQWISGNLGVGQVIDLINSWADPAAYPSY
jgi:hypothetical protein